MPATDNELKVVARGGSRNAIPTSREDGKWSLHHEGLGWVGYGTEQEKNEWIHDEPGSERLVTFSYD